MDLNKAMIIGRLTRDPEARSTPNGAQVTSFSIATNFTWKGQDGQQQERVEYHNIVAWRKLAEICAQYLQKGKRVYIEGRLQTRDWEGQDGQKRYRTEIVADNMIMLDGPGGGGQGGGNLQQNRPPQQQQQQSQQNNNAAPQAAQAPAPDNISDDEVSIEDIPF